MKHQPIHPPAPPAEPDTLVQRALGGHAAIGLLAGAILYIIALSGTLVVIHERWQRWEQPAVAEMTTIAPDALQRAFATLAKADPDKPPTTHLYARLPTPGLPRTVVFSDYRATYVDAGGRPLGPEAPGWTQFLVALHEYLHLPTTLGLIVVGAFGVMLAVLVVTGVLAHPRILRDAFRLRAKGNRQLAQADWHNRLGVWTLPFALALALTGAFIGLAALNATPIAKAYHGGDILAVYAPIFGGEGKPDPAPAPLADAAAALRTMAARAPDATPTYVTIHDPGTAGQHIQVLADMPRRLIYGETFEFDGAGRLHGRVGLSDGAVGQQVAASTYKLHFGNFGGAAVELAYIAFGLALCVVTATGMSLWLQKRRRKGMAAPRLEGFWTAIVWGTPIAILATLWLRATLGPDAPMAGAFWGLMAALCLIAMLRPRLADADNARRGLAVGIVLTALVHAAWLSTDAVAVMAIDAGLLVVAVALLLGGRGRAAQR